MNEAKAGDIIQYRYLVGSFVNYDTRRVVLIEDNVYWVEGGYFVPQKNVLLVIPDNPPESGSSAEHRPFPLEVNQ